MQELDLEEINQVSGSGPALAVVAVVAVVCIASYAVGVYNGYSDEAKKSNK